MARLVPAMPASCSGFLIPYAFSLLTIATLSAKCFLLFNYISSVGLGWFILFLPTLFAQDVAFICIIRLLLRKGNRLSSLLHIIPGVIFA